MKVLAWPAFANRRSNPYQTRLYTEISQGNSVQDIRFTLRDFIKIFRFRYDIVHLHWIERVLWGQSVGRVPVRMVCFAVSIWLLKLKGAHVVWTVHDPEPHRMAENERAERGLIGALWPWYRNVALRSIDGLIFLSPSHVGPLFARYPSLSGLPRAVIPHPHYRDVYDRSMARPDARQRLGLEGDQFAIVFVGKIRPYKNLEDLIRSFRKFSDPDARLIVAGEAESETSAAEIRELAAGDVRIHLVLTFIADNDLQIFLHGADVVVIPFARATNSGSVLLALSFDLPVAVPNIPVFQELQEIVGPEWMYLFDGPLTAENLRLIRLWATSTKRPKSAPLEVLDWDRAAAQTVSFYATVHAKRAAP